jgi:hypothetical protein
VAVVFATVGFFALLVAGFGLLSLATDAEVLPVAGLGPAPGIVGTAAAVVAFAAVRRSFGPRDRRTAASWLVAVGCFRRTWSGCSSAPRSAGVDLARAIAAGGFATSWFAAPRIRRPRRRVDCGRARAHPCRSAALAVGARRRLTGPPEASLPAAP